jgi:hypothetical protein
MTMTHAISWLVLAGIFSPPIYFTLRFLFFLVAEREAKPSPSLSRPAYMSFTAEDFDWNRQYWASRRTWLDEGSEAALSKMLLCVTMKVPDLDQVRKQKW